MTGRIDLKAEYDALKSSLKTLGLSSYESRAYIALVAYGYGDAEFIAKTARIPRTSSYKALSGLEKKGFTVSSEGRPRVYRPISPENLREKFVKRIEETFEKLALLRDMVSEYGEPQIVYTISGKEKVLEKIGELLDTTTKRFMIATPAISDIREALSKNFSAALTRGVEITVITEPFQRPPPHSKTFRKKGLIATDIISDGERALLAAHDLSACGYTDNPALAEHLENFLYIMISD